MQSYQAELVRQGKVKNYVNEEETTSKAQRRGARLSALDHASLAAQLEAELEQDGEEPNGDEAFDDDDEDEQLAA